MFIKDNNFNNLANFMSFLANKQIIRWVQKISINLPEYISFFLIQEMKNIVITGGNSGVGLETARGLYMDGHNIIIGSRNVQKNIEAIQDIMRSHPQSKGQIRYFTLDLSKRESVQGFANFVKKEFKVLDILINNSGLILNEREISELGVQMTYAINHFGHFYLTYLLFPLLKESVQARIINVSSVGHFQASQSLVNDVRCDNGWGGFSSYFKSKLANVMFTVALADKLSNNPKIKAMSLHPGPVASDFYSRSKLLSCMLHLCCCCFVGNERGAMTSLFLSRISFSQLQSGQYYDDDTRRKEMNALARNRSENERLWDKSEKLYDIKFEV